MQIANSGDFYGFLALFNCGKFRCREISFATAILYFIQKKQNYCAKKNIIKKVTPNKNSFFYHISLKNSYPGILSFFIRTFCNHFACLKFNNFDPLWLGIFIHHFSLLFLASKKALSSEFLKDPYNAWWVIIAAAFFTELRYAFL